MVAPSPWSGPRPNGLSQVNRARLAAGLGVERNGLRYARPWDYALANRECALGVTKVGGKVRLAVAAPPARPELTAGAAVFES
jgi:hypothetical protein